MKHGTEKRGLIFAIAVLVSEHLPRWVRLMTSNSNLNGRIANLLLRVVRQHFHFLERVRHASGQLGDFLLNLRSCVAAGSGQRVVPVADFLP